MVSCVVTQNSCRQNDLQCRQDNKSPRPQLKDIENCAQQSGVRRIVGFDGAPFKLCTLIKRYFCDHLWPLNGHPRTTKTTATYTAIAQYQQQPKWQMKQPMCFVSHEFLTDMDLAETRRRWRFLLSSSIRSTIHCLCCGDPAVCLADATTTF